MMTQEEKLLLQVLDAALHNRPLPTIPEDSWEGLSAEMEAQCVSILPADLLDSFPMNPEETEYYLSSIGKSIQYFYNLMQEQDKVVRLLQEAGIPAVILKGAAAAMSYPHPEYRTMGDIDILVAQEQFKDAYQVLSSHEYHVHGNETPENFTRHIGFSGDAGIEVELHHNFSSGLNKNHNEVLDRLLDRSVPQATHRDINGFSVPVLPTLENGLVLLGHIRQHLGDGLGLRQILDWMMYVEAYLDDEFWKTSFEQAAASVGLKKLALTTTAMCQKYLGLSASITWCQSADDDLCDSLIAYVLARGNFGRKMDHHENIATVRLRMLRSPKQFFYIAQKFGKANWKLLKKYPKLKCFAWLYQILVWPAHALKKGYTPASVLKQRKKAKSTGDFLDQLQD